MSPSCSACSANSAGLLCSLLPRTIPPRDLSFSVLPPFEGTTATRDVGGHPQAIHLMCGFRRASWREGNNPHATPMDGRARPRWQPLHGRGLPFVRQASPSWLRGLCLDEQLRRGRGKKHFADVSQRFRAETDVSRQMRPVDIRWVEFGSFHHCTWSFGPRV